MHTGRRRGVSWRRRMCVIVLMLAGAWCALDSWASPGVSRGVEEAVSAEPLAAAVEEPSHTAPRRLPHPIPDGVLPPGNRKQAGLRLEFWDAAGMPVSGVRVLLTHCRDAIGSGGPDSLEALAHRFAVGAGFWSGISDRRGVAAWPDLPPAKDYRFAVVSGHAVRCRPRGVRRGTSGSFALAAGAALRFRNRVLAGTIRGRLSVGAEAPGTAVLYRVEGRGGCVLRSVGRACADPAAGTFCFGGVGRGDYRVRVQRAGPGFTEFATRSAAIGESGWQVDLGSIAPTPSEELSVCTQLVDQKGRRLTPVDAAGWPAFRIGVLAGSGEGRVQDRLSLLPGRCWRLRGLPREAPVRLASQGPIGAVPVGWRVLPFDPARDARWIETRLEPAVLPLRVERLRALRVRWTRGDEQDAETVRVILSAPGFRRAEECRVGADVATWTQSWFVPQEAVRIYAWVDRQKMRWAALVTSRGPGDVSLALAPCRPRTVRLEARMVGHEVAYGPASIPFPVARTRVPLGRSIRCLGIPEGIGLAIYGLGDATPPTEAGGRPIEARVP